MFHDSRRIDNVHESISQDPVPVVDTAQEETVVAQLPLVPSQERLSCGLTAFTPTAPPSSSLPMIKDHTLTEIHVLKIASMERKGGPPSSFSASAAMRRAVSVAGDNVTASLNWRRDNSGSNKITRPMVITAKARRTGVVSPAEEAAPQPTPGEVSLHLPRPETSRFELPASEEPDAKRVRLYAPINTYGGKTLNERQCAALAAARDNNVVVFGEVGSGKSLLVSAIVDTYATAESKALVLTLRPDSFAGLPRTADILTPAQLTNCLYPENKGLRAIRDANVPAKWSGAAYGRIVVDDFQTFTEDRYCVLLSFLACLPCTPLLAVLGCRRPAMVGYPAGDVRFLEHVANLIASPHPWHINGDMVTLAFDLYRRTNQRGAVEEIAQQAIDDQARRSGFIQRKVALAGHSLDWMAQDLPRAVDRLSSQFLPQEDLTHEAYLSSQLYVDGYSVTISGWADVIVQTPSGTTIWEIKLVAELTVQHVVQVVVYGFLWSMKNGWCSSPD
ncbi:hypothetical protein B0H11DRAFT_2293658 [Mycena galericulata]|nr:hypothetical protein B0H11DRAFT_2293658 [Mycena galericulata]